MHNLNYILCTTIFFYFLNTYIGFLLFVQMLEQTMQCLNRICLKSMCTLFHSYFLCKYIFNPGQNFQHLVSVCHAFFFYRFRDNFLFNFLCSTYRALYLINWVYRFFVENHKYHWIRKFLYPLFCIFSFKVILLTRILVKCKEQLGFQAWSRLLFMQTSFTIISRGMFHALFFLVFSYAIACFVYVATLIHLLNTLNRI